MYFRIDELRKTWLETCLRSSLWEDPSKSNMGNNQKYCSNLNESTFIIFVDPCEENSGWKNLSALYAKSEFTFSKFRFNFEHFPKNDGVMSFWNYGLRKTWLEKCLKTPVSEDPSTSNMGNGRKHCSKLKDSIFTIFIDHCEGNFAWKSISEWYAKSHDFLLTHWLLITSIFYLIDRIYSNFFRCNYLRNEKYILILFCLF